jgi:D-alanyl-D-alanine carboxypeptidase
MMSGISEIQSRIQSIQHRVVNPPPAGRFDAVFQAQMATIEARTTTSSEPDASQEGEYTVEPAALQTSVDLGSTPVTLGAMLGFTGTPTFTPRSTSAVRSEDLATYMTVQDIEARNGHLEASELTPISGAWNGTGRLLPPAADAWEEMRAAAAGDGIDLRAIDSYRAWDVQNRAYEAHLRGDKTANVLPPGESEHGNGLAVDITNGHLVGVGDPEYSWLRNNAAGYGWYPISNESWHWEFRGT